MVVCDGELRPLRVVFYTFEVVANQPSSGLCLEGGGQSAEVYEVETRLAGHTFTEAELPAV